MLSLDCIDQVLRNSSPSPSPLFLFPLFFSPLLSTTELSAPKPSNLESMAPSPLQQAYLDAYAAACDQVPHDLRRTLILFGGAASIAHGILDRKTKDVDILVSVEVLSFLDDAINNRRGGFHRDYDGTIKWDKVDHQGNFLFEVVVEVVELGGPFVPLVPEVVGFGNGFVATLPELVRLRASTLVGRGDAQDLLDFARLLEVCARRGLKLPHLLSEEMVEMIDAVEEVGELLEGAEEMFLQDLGTFEDNAGVSWASWWEFLLVSGCCCGSLP